MARVLLVRPPWDVFLGLKSKQIPLGLCYIASVLKDAGHECLVFDGDLDVPVSPPSHKWVEYKILVDYDQYFKALNDDHVAWKKIKSIIKSFKPDIVGITMPTGLYSAALRVAKIVKDTDSEIPVVVGGPHPTILPEDTIRKNFIDIVIRGEGEYTMLDITNTFDKGKALDDVQGITYKNKEIIHHNPPRLLIRNLDLIPFPARDLIFDKEKYSPDSFGFVITSRGCPFKCIYCSSAKIWGRTVRYRSPENVITELKEVKQTFGTNLFRFNDDTFTLNKDRALKICELIVKEKLDIKWYCDTRVDLLSHDLLTRMKEAGCIRINLGIESGNPAILKSIEKGITLEQAKLALNMAKEVGIPTLAYFMIGFPNEGRKEIMDTITFMKDTKPDNVCWGIVTPYPGTELYEIGRKQGLLPETLDWSAFFHQSPNMGVTDRLSKEEFLQVIKEIHYVTDELYADYSMVKNYLSSPSLFHYRMRLYLRRPGLISRDIRYIIRAMHRRAK